MKRSAAIDIGTNTALVLVADVTDEGVIRPLYQEERIVRLGEGVDEQRLLKPSAITRTLDAIEGYIRKAEEYRIDQIVVSGTSAVRDATNREDFLRQVRQRFGIKMRVLTGEQEATLTYFGALSNKVELGGTLLLIDIGGGSTECVMGDRLNIKRLCSLDIGSVRITERYVRNDPVTRQEAGSIRNHVRETVRHQLAEWKTAPQHLLGVGGTITTLAAMDLAMQDYDASKIENYTLTKGAVRDLLQRLIKSELAERCRMPGLRPERADVIVGGATIVMELLNFWGLQGLMVSDRGLRFGLLLESVGVRRYNRRRTVG